MHRLGVFRTAQSGVALIVVSAAACGGAGHSVDEVTLAVGAVAQVGKGACTVAVSPAVASKPGYKDDGVELTALAPGPAKVDCQDDKFDAYITVREVDKLELVVRDAPSAIRVGDTLPVVCLVARDSNGRELSIGDIALDVEVTFSEHVERIPQSPDHGMGASIFGSGTLGCRYEMRAAKAGTATVTGTWNGKSATRSLEIAVGK